MIEHLEYTNEPLQNEAIDLLKALGADKRLKECRILSEFKCIDLFSGAGGFSNGFLKENFEIVLAIDNFDSAAKTYKRNHKNVNFINEDIRTINKKDILKKIHIDKEKIDLIIGGPPCQGFSTVGKRSSNDLRNELFKEYVRIVKYINPEYFVMENVTGILNIDRGKFLDRIISSFKNIGYNIKYKTLNAVNYGIPQNRERVIFIGSKNNEEITFPEPTHSNENDLFSQGINLQRELTLWDAISDLPEIEAGEQITNYKTEPKNNYQKSRRKNSKKLTLHKASNHGKKTVKMMKYIPEGKSVWEVENIPDEYMPNSGYKNTYARLESNVPGMTITRNFSCVSSSRCIHPFQDRGLTSREAARIQSFDDDFIFEGTKSKIALQIGNAVPPILAKKVAKKIKSMLVSKKIKI